MRSRSILLVLLLLAPATVRAESGETALSVAVGAMLHRAELPEDETDWGGSGMVAFVYERGLSASLWFRASAQGSAGQVEAGRLYSSSGSVGMTYRWDVLKWVPQISVSLGGQIDFGEAAVARLTPVLDLELALDRLTSRERSWGPWIGYRQELDDTDLSFSGGLRWSWRWGYF